MIRILSLLLLTSTCFGQLAGDYQLTFKSTPLGDGFFINDDDLLVDSLPLTIQPDGSFSITIDGETGTGQATLASPGLYEATVTDSVETIAFDFYATPSLSTMVALNIEPGDFQDLIVLSRKPDTLPVFDDIQGEWTFVSMETPTMVGSSGENGGNVGLLVGTFDVTSASSAQVDVDQLNPEEPDGGVTGSVPYSLDSDGLTVEPISKLFFNGDKTLLTGVDETEDNYQSLTLMLKRPTSATLEELEGNWYVVSIEVDHVHGVNQGTGNSFFAELEFDGEVTQATISVDEGLGTITGRNSEGVFSGTVTTTANGRVTVSDPGDTDVILHLGADGKGGAGDLFVGWEFERFDFGNENIINYDDNFTLRIGVRNTGTFPVFQPDFGFAVNRLPDGSLRISWNGGDDIVLQRRFSLNDAVSDWADVTQAGDPAEYSPTDVSGVEFFRVLQR
ncbi:MAG: hypothetical protein ACFB21_04775 [Opitutales bacterium]